MLENIQNIKNKNSLSITHSDTFFFGFCFYIIEHLSYISSMCGYNNGVIFNWNRHTQSVRDNTVWQHLLCFINFNKDVYLYFKNQINFIIEVTFKSWYHIVLVSERQMGIVFSYIMVKTMKWCPFCTRPLRLSWYL